MRGHVVGAFGRVAIIRFARRETGGKHRARSRSTSGSAFSWIKSDALGVRQEQREQSVSMPASRTKRRTLSVRSVKPGSARGHRDRGVLLLHRARSPARPAQRDVKGARAAMLDMGLGDAGDERLQARPGQARAASFAQHAAFAGDHQHDALVVAPCSREKPDERAIRARRGSCRAGRSWLRARSARGADRRRGARRWDRPAARDRPGALGGGGRRRARSPCGGAVTRARARSGFASPSDSRNSACSSSDVATARHSARTGSEFGARSKPRRPPSSAGSTVIRPSLRIRPAMEAASAL